MINLRWKILLPPCLFGVLAAAYLAWGWLPEVMLPAGRTALAMAVLATAAAFLVVSAITVDRQVIQPLAGLARHPGEIFESGDLVNADPSAGNEIQAVKLTIEALTDSATRQRRHECAVEQRCREIEAALRLSEERYALALRGSSDGLWEWNLASGEMLLSPRWKSMLGFADSDLPDCRERWRERIHADDRAAVEAAIQAKLESTGEPYEQQYRMLHRDGSTRWILSRGTVVRHASGKAYRMVGLDTDITRIKRFETILNEMAEGTAGAAGDAFYRTLVQHFACALQVSCAFITQCADYPTSRLRTLAFWSGHAFLDDFEYDLPGTPCETVVKEGRVCFHPQNVGTTFPVEAGYEGYLGIPIFASDGKVIGHLAFLDTRPMGDEMLIASIYRVFAARAGAEMEREMALEVLRLQAAKHAAEQPQGSPHGTTGSGS
ncbi:PAS domain-containing protein [Candidatus Accumulibacter phosphatis]|uniref:histidine kinase n=1 Tax=Candidatus Accumulibacter phosphatis TaxID=327160 RepID=A0A5S4EJG5_9PROT|nr:PAS domain-containing protein [Candidatus Accumulibacter phosphatis]TMQ75451.1 diguanylate cyclase/phosphodiesterase (GGDEF & EAL domains) with PAS/PAC sensor(s) [Candidatus Accumulibacter phosphatis]